MICNNCEKSVEGDEYICENCQNVALHGSYAICVKCGKISAAFCDPDYDKNKRYFSSTCYRCEENNPNFTGIRKFYENPDHAKEELKNYKDKGDQNYVL
jgi:hypothetical protein